jgi:signal transduction histidine kinase
MSSLARNPVTAAFAPLASFRTWKGVVYLAVGFAIGIGEFVFLVTGLAVGFGLSIIIVGIPLLLAVVTASRALGAMDRFLANALLDAHIETPPAHRHAEGPLLQRLRAVVMAPSTWRSLGWLVLRFPLSLVSFVVPVALLGAAVALVLEPLVGGLQDAAALPRVASFASAGALVFLALNAVDGFAAIHRIIAGGLLGPSNNDELVRLRADTARLGARADLARDLHDSVGHSVTAIVLQASAARRVLETDQAFVAGALEAIESQGREAMDELDRVLAVLRDEPSGTRPPAGLGEIDDLVGRTRAAGLPITLERRGDLAAVPPAIGREAYRVLQEALTNVLRHASGATTSALVSLDSVALEIVVANGPGTAIVPERVNGGRGLRGIAERVGAVGGTLEHGPDGSGGYRLRAVFPRVRP